MTIIRGIKPLAAFLGTLGPTGNIDGTGDRFSDPTTQTVIVAEFAVGDKYYRGIYHDDLDAWEMQTDSGTLLGGAHPETECYEACDFVVQQQGLFGTSCNAILLDQLSRAMQDMMACEIHTVQTDKTVAPSIPVLKGRSAGIDGAYKLRANWSIEAEQDLRGFHGIVVSQRYKGAMVVINELP